MIQGTLKCGAIIQGTVGLGSFMQAEVWWARLWGLDACLGPLGLPHGSMGAICHVHTRFSWQVFSGLSVMRLQQLSEPPRLRFMQSAKGKGMELYLTQKEKLQQQQHPVRG